MSWLGPGQLHKVNKHIKLSTKNSDADANAIVHNSKPIKITTNRKSL